MLDVSKFTGLLTMRFLPKQTDLGLVMLRIGLGITLFLRHGWEKRPGHWQQFLSAFPDPIGIGSQASFLFAFTGDFICTLLLIVGFGTRWASLFCFLNILVAWAFVHHFAFLGKDPASDHGELIVLYLVALLALLIAGPGHASIDAFL